MSSQREGVRTVLAEEGVATADADVILGSVEEGEGDRPDAALEALVKSKRPGQRAEIYSRRFSNLLVNWRDLMTKVVPAGVSAAAATVAKPPVGAFACLAAVRALWDATKVTLSADHAAVVEAIWGQKAGVVRRESLREVAGRLQTPLDKVLTDLQDLKVILFEDDDTIRKVDYLTVREAPASL